MTDLLDQFRAITANIDKAIDEDPEAPTWSTSLVRVANFLSDKIATNPSDTTNTTSVDNFCTLPRGRQMQRNSVNTAQPTSRSSSIVQSLRALGFRSNSINPARDNEMPPPPTSNENSRKIEELKRELLPPVANRTPMQRDHNGNPMKPRQMHKSASVKGKWCENNMDSTKWMKSN